MCIAALNAPGFFVSFTFTLVDAGVMIYYPVFGAFPSFYGGSMDDHHLRDSVSIRKDVEGLSNTYVPQKPAKS